MPTVSVSKTSGILSLVIFILLALTVGLLVLVLKETNAEGSALPANQNPSVSSPHTDIKAATTQSPKDQQDSAAHTTALPDEAPWKDFRLPKFILPVHYDLLLQPDLNTDIFTGTVSIAVAVTRQTKYFIVHAHRLTITDAKVYDVEQDAELNVEVQFPYLPNEYYVLQTENQVNPGRYKIYFAFSGTLNGSIVGFYKSRYKNSKNETRYLATSKFQPTYARQAFPCFDEPSFKSTFTVSLVHEKNYTALSNMPAEVTEPVSGTSLYMTRFQKSVPMVTYLACFIVSDFQYRATTTSSGKPFRVYAVPDLVNTTAYAMEVGSRVLNYFENYFQIDYPLPKMDMVAIPDFSSGAMEHWGLVTFRETNLLYDPDNSSPQNQQRVAEVIAHEMTHMWFGNLMTMEWWDDLWLNEGFASYMEYKGVEEQHPEWSLMSRFITADMQPVMDSDSSLNSHPIVQPVAHPDEITEIFDRISYAKGASILRMLEFFVGNDNFRKGISGFLKKHEYKNAKTADLWKQLSDSSGYKGNLSIPSIMKTWTEQMGFPYVTIKRQSQTKFIVKQNRFMKSRMHQREKADSSLKYTWSIPLSYLTSDERSGIVWLHDDAEMELTLPVENSEWVKFNANQTGYYLVNYETEDWNKLTNLLLTDHEALSPSDRSNLLFDSFLLAQAGHIGLDVFLSMSTYLKKETDLTPWETASCCFRKLSDLLETSEAKLLLKNVGIDDKTSCFYAVKISGHIKDLTDSLYKKLGWKTQDSHMDNLLVAVINNMACRAGNQDCLTQASQLFQNWTKGQEGPSNLRSLVYKFGIAESGRNEDWNYMWNKYLMEESPALKKTYLAGLAYAKQPHLINRYLEYAMDETKVRSQDFFIVLMSILENPIGRPLVWTFIRENWPAIVERFTLNSRYLGNLVNKICSSFTSDREMQEMQAFFSKYPDAGAGKRGRLQALETVQNNIQWIRRHSNGIRNWLELEGPAPWTYYRLPAHIVPEHYDLTLHPILDKDVFTGTVTITVALKKPSDHFLVHEVDLNVTKIEVTSGAGVVELENVFKYKENDLLVLKTKEKLPIGTYELYFEFQGPFKLSLEGLYKSSYLNPDTKEIRYLATTQFEAISARKAFPCFDEPAFKSTFNISIIHDSEHFALSNTMVENVTEIDDNLRLTKFEKTVPMVTYLLAMVVCDFKFKETVTETGVQLRVYAAPHHIEKTYYSLDVASRVLTWFEKYFDVPFPLKKIDMIAVPDFGSNGMENWGLITFSEQSLISENVSSVASKSHISSIISHELAHMWFGDLVTMNWWSDLWLNEGFATFMSVKGLKLVEPDLDKEDEEATSFLMRAMCNDQTINSHPIVQPVITPNSEIFDSVTYQKGSTILRMLENYMGDDFREGISVYLKKYSFRTTVTQNLWDALTAASKQDLNVSALMDTWTKQMNHPVLTVVRSKNGSGNQYFIQQRRFLSDPDTEVFATPDSPYNYVWQIPLTYYTSDSREVLHVFLNSSEKVKLTVPRSEWVKFNVNFTGYFLVNYDRKSWENFIEVLENDHMVLSPADRLNLLYDAFSLASAGYLEYEIPLNLTRYLKKEQYHEVWTVALKKLLRIKWFFRGDKEMEKILLEHIRSLSTDFYKKYAWNDSGDYSERKLRTVVIKAACGSENSDCLQTASRLFGEWMNGTLLGNEIKELVYEYGLQVRNNEESWKFLWKQYLEENDPFEKDILILALTTTGNTTHLEKLMEEAKNESQVRKHHYLNLMYNIAQNPKGFVLVTRLIYNNWTHLVKTYGAIKTSEFARKVFRGYYTQKDLEQVRMFYRTNVKTKIGGKARTLAIEEINRNINWVRKHQEYVRNWFQNNVYMPWKNVRLSRSVIPTRYDITLHPNISKSTFEGEESIELNITQDTDYIALHESGLTVTNVEVRRLSPGEAGVTVQEAFPFKRNEFFVIRFADRISKGLYELKLGFKGRFSKDGKGMSLCKYIHRDTKETRYLVATQFEATYARKVFPCFDEPDMKAKFQLNIIHDSIHNAVSNMPEEKQETLKNNLLKTVFAESPAMSSYVLFVAVSDFKYIQAFHNQTQVRVFAPPDRLHEAEHGLNLTVELLRNLEEYFDVPYSLPKLDSVVIVNYTVPAMEHWGVIAYNSKRFLVDDAISPYKRMLEVDRVIAHEIVHQWFGNLVTMKWWSDLWLNEGMSTLIMYIPLRQYYSSIDGVDVRKISRVMCVDSSADSHPIVRSATTPDEIANAFDAISYEKGSAVLKMLQHTLKDDFRKGLSQYLKRYAFKNAETGDLWKELSEASTVNINVSEIMATWTDQMGFPYVELKRNGGTVTATQRWFVRDINDTVAALIASNPRYSRFGFVWHIPLMYKNIQTGEEHTYWLREKNATFQINASRDDLVHFNPGFTGFYIVKYDSHDWARLGKRLQSNYTDFTVTDRYSLLHDAFLLAETDRLIYDIPFEFTKYLKQEIESIPWNLFRDQLLHFMNHLDRHSEAARLLKVYVADLTSKLFDEHVMPKTIHNKSYFKKQKSKAVGCSYTVPDLDFISIIIDLACHTSNEKCLEAMHEELQLWMRGQNITADVHLALEVAIPRFGDTSLWNNLYNEMITAETNPNRKNLLAEGLTSFRDSFHVNKTIEVVAEDPNVDSTLAKFMFQKLINNPEAMPMLWDYAKHNWDSLMIRLNATINPSLWISHFCEKFKTKEQFEDFVTFVEQVPNISGYIVRGCVQDIQDALEWSEKYEETLTTWLMWNLNQ